MVLDLTDRGAIERIIEVRIGEIRDIMTMFRKQSVREQNQIRDADEFAYGYVYGKIIASCEALLIHSYDRTMRQDEIDEMFEIMEKRSREIKDAIYQCG